MGSVNEYQLRLGRQRQVRLISIADERVGVLDPLRTRAIHCQKNRVERGRKLFPRVDIVRVRVEISYLQLFNPSKGRFSYPGL